ncbi:hypothetical protein ACQPXH_20105 [Nocardia sp. CA-135953]|uniref:hypothetical protein n=1 Tax=Nocardia sp. CA-135953 TaxID=3239978 RepID=UPI003D99DFFD
MRYDGLLIAVEKAATLSSSYRLWAKSRYFSYHALDVDEEHVSAIHRLLDDTDESRTVEVQLITEPDGPRGPAAISVRAGERTIGYLPDYTASKWSGIVNRVLASGFVPTSDVDIDMYDENGVLTSTPTVSVMLGNPAYAIPMNDPPRVPYTILPRSSVVYMTEREVDLHTLRRFVRSTRPGLLFVTLHENTAVTCAEPRVEVRINEERIAQLNPQMSQRFHSMILHLNKRGLVATCLAYATSAAKAVTKICIEIDEAPQEMLDAPPVTFPPLPPARADPLAYDLTPMRALLAPPPPMPAVMRPSPQEPDEGSVVRFKRTGLFRQYNFVAVRRGDHWETTATSDTWVITQQMKWDALTARARTFEIATSWAPADLHEDARTPEHRSVIRFITGRGHLAAAVNIFGDWYTTITESMARQLPIDGVDAWSTIVQHGEQILLARDWKPLNPTVASDT